MTMSTPHDPYNTPGNDDRGDLPDLSGSSDVPKPAGRPEPPSSIVNAVRLMFVGAVLSAITIASAIAAIDGMREDIAEDNPDFSADEIDAAVNIGIGVAVALGVIGIGLWIWMALANRRGLSWARVVASILGGLYILYNLFGLLATSGLGTVISLIAIGLAGSIIWLLFRPESSQYYNAVTDYRKHLRR